jgi:hypothetical protein
VNILSVPGLTQRRIATGKLPAAGGANTHYRALVEGERGGGGIRGLGSQ